MALFKHELKWLYYTNCAQQEDPISPKTPIITVSLGTKHVGLLQVPSRGQRSTCSQKLKCKWQWQWKMYNGHKQIVSLARHDSSPTSLKFGSVIISSFKIQENLLTQFSYHKFYRNYYSNDGKS